MAYIQLHDSLPDHPKTQELAQNLKIAIPQAVGHLACLWLWAIRVMPDGDLAECSDGVIARAAAWSAVAAGFVRALTAARYLDADRRLHNWSRYTNSYKLARERADRRRRARGADTAADTYDAGRGQVPEVARTGTGSGAAPAAGSERSGAEQNRISKAEIGATEVASRVNPSLYGGGSVREGESLEPTSLEITEAARAADAKASKAGAYAPSPQKPARPAPHRPTQAEADAQARESLALTLAAQAEDLAQAKVQTVPHSPTSGKKRAKKSQPRRAGDGTELPAPGTEWAEQWGRTDDEVDARKRAERAAAAERTDELSRASLVDALTPSMREQLEERRRAAADNGGPKQDTECIAPAPPAQAPTDPVPQLSKALRPLAPGIDVDAEDPW